MQLRSVPVTPVDGQKSSSVIPVYAVERGSLPMAFALKPLGALEVDVLQGLMEGGSNSAAGGVIVG